MSDFTDLPTQIRLSVYPPELPVRSRNVKRTGGRGLHLGRLDSCDSSPKAAIAILTPIDQIWDKVSFGQI